MKRFSVCLFVVSICFLTWGVSNAIQIETMTVMDGNEGELLEFSVSVTEAVGDVSYFWDFGDGWYASSEWSPDHVYADDGSFVVEVSVTDESDTVKQSAEASIWNVAPFMDSIADQSVSVGQPISMGVPFIDAGVNDTHTCSVTWGDGTTDASVYLEEMGGSGILQLYHMYADVGEYVANAFLVDDDGGANMQLFNVTVAPIPEPTTMLLLGTGIVGLVGFRRKFKK